MTAPGRFGQPHKDASGKEIASTKTPAPSGPPKLPTMEEYAAKQENKYRGMAGAPPVKPRPVPPPKKP